MSALAQKCRPRPGQNGISAVSPEVSFKMQICVLKWQPVVARPNIRNLRGFPCVLASSKTVRPLNSFRGASFPQICGRLRNAKSKPKHADLLAIIREARAPGGLARSDDDPLQAHYSKKNPRRR